MPLTLFWLAPARRANHSVAWARPAPSWPATDGRIATVDACQARYSASWCRGYRRKPKAVLCPELSRCDIFGHPLGCGGAVAGRCRHAHRELHHRAATEERLVVEHPRRVGHPQGSLGTSQDILATYDHPRQRWLGGIERTVGVGIDPGVELAAPATVTEELRRGRGRARRYGRRRGGGYRVRRRRSNGGHAGG